jgi:hypothetical protein
VYSKFTEKEKAGGELTSPPAPSQRKDKIGYAFAYFNTISTNIIVVKG